MDLLDLEIQELRTENSRLEAMEQKLMRGDVAEYLRERNKELREKFHKPKPELLSFLVERAKKAGFKVE